MIRKISFLQAAILLFLCSSFNTINYIPALYGKQEGLTLLIAAAAAFVLELICLIPFYFFTKKTDQDVISACYGRSKIFGIIIAVIYFIGTVGTIVGTSVSFTFFMTNTSYPNASSIFMVTSMLIACFAAARFGIEGLSRCAVLIFIYFIINILFITIAVSPSIATINIHPILEKPVESVITTTLSIFSRSYELLVFILIFQNIKSKKKSAGGVFLLATFLFMEFSMFLVVGVLGEYGLSQTFPYCSLASTASLSVFQRLDSLHMILWVMLSFLRITLFILAAKKTATYFVPHKASGFITPILIFITLVPSILISLSVNNIFGTNLQSPIPNFIYVVVIPLIALLITKKKRKGGKENDKTDTVSLSHR